MMGKLMKGIGNSIERGEDIVDGEVEQSIEIISGGLQ